jgi:hypothetical protein
MDPQSINVGIDVAVIATVTAATVALTELIKFSSLIPERYGLLIAMLVSAFVIGLVAYEYKVTSPMSLFLGWISVLTSAAGVWGIARNVHSEAVVDMKKMSVVAALLLLPVGMGCANREATRTTLVTVDSTIYNALAGYQDLQDSLHRAGQIPDEQYRQLNAALIPALRTGQTFNRVVRAWDVSQPMPKELRELAPQLVDLAATLTNALPDGDIKSQLQNRLLLVQAAVLGFLAGTSPPAQGADYHGTNPERGAHLGTSGRTTGPDWTWVLGSYPGSVQPVG